MQSLIIFWWVFGAEHEARIEGGNVKLYMVLFDLTNIFVTSCWCACHTKVAHPADSPDVQWNSGWK